MFSEILIFTFIGLISLNGLNSQHDDEIDGRIAGGSGINIADATYQAYVIIPDSFCGGSILSTTWLLTAAHCSTDDDGNDLSPNDLGIAIGVQDINDYDYVYEIKQIVNHPDYENELDGSDIALLNTKLALELGKTAQPIQLATSLPAVGSPLTVTGYGAAGYEKKATEKLNKIVVNVIDFDKCNKQYQNNLMSKMFCAFADGKDTCQGDSGGPAVYYDSALKKNTLVGVISFGYKCNVMAGIYTDVSQFVPWIQKYVK